MEYDEEQGLVPSSREHYLERLYHLLVEQGVYSASFNHFLGSNWHRFFSSAVIPLLLEQQEAVIAANDRLFTFWQQHHLAIAGGMGASYEGIRNLFEPYCQSLSIITVQQDSRLERAGCFSLYFDDLQVQDDQQLSDLFRKTMPAAATTPLGDHSIEVSFSGSHRQSYRYFNITPEQYTLLDLRVHVKYKASMSQYSAKRIIDSVQKQFDQINHIGRAFYPNAYFDHEHLNHLASMRIDSSLADEYLYSDQVRPCDFAQKYQLRHLEVVVHE